MSGSAPDRSFAPSAVRAAYDTVAVDYEVAFGDDLAELPLDRQVLGRAASGVPAGGLAIDVGCGTGVAAAEVARHGVAVVGVDLSEGMLDVARNRRRLSVIQGDARRLPVGEALCDLVVAFYVVQHVPRGELPVLRDEFARVLRPGGGLVVAAHLGEGEVSAEEFLGHRIESLGGTLFALDELIGALDGPQFAVESTDRRAPLEHEYPSSRAYLMARRRT